MKHCQDKPVRPLNGTLFWSKHSSLRCNSARHPDFRQSDAGRAPQMAGVVVPERDDPSRYARNDLSSWHAYEARQGFVKAIAAGEPGMRLAEAALHASAMDDALVSHSTVALPVQSFLERIDSITSHVRSQLQAAVPHLLAPGSAASRASQRQNVNPQSAEEILSVVERALFAEPLPRPQKAAPAPGQGQKQGGSRLLAQLGRLKLVQQQEQGSQGRVKGQQQQQQQQQQQGATSAPGQEGPGHPSGASSQAPVSSWGLTAPEHGRSALPRGVAVHHAGAWEDARDAQLDQTLIRRTGHPAALAIIYAEVMSRLLTDGTLDFAVAMDVGDYDDPPQGVPLPGISRAMILGRDGRPARHLNTCTSDVVMELQRHWKRTYHPFAWDNNGSDCYERGGNNSWGGFRSAAQAAVGEDVDASIRALSTVARWRLERGIWTSPGAGDIRRAVAAAERLVLLCEAAKVTEEVAIKERRDLAALLLHKGEVGAAHAELGYVLSSRAFKASMEPEDRDLCYQLMKVVSGAAESLGTGAPAQARKEPLSLKRVIQEGPPQDQDGKVLPLTW